MIETPRRASRGPVRQSGRAAGEPPGADSAHADSGAIDERVRHLLWLVTCCLLLAVLAFVSRPGNILADTKIDMATDPLTFLDRALHLWDPSQFGQLQNQAVGYFFPMGPFFVLGKLMALPSWVVQRLWLTAISVAAFLGVCRLASRFGIGTPGTRIAAGLAYALAPRGLSLLGVNSGELLPATMLPLVLLPLVRLLRHGHEMDRRDKLRAAAQVAAAVALCSGMNAASIVAVLSLALVYVLTGEASWPRWRVLAWCGPAVVAATLWWTIPLLLLGKYGVSILPYSESAQVTTSVTSLSNMLRGTEDWTTYLTVNGSAWWPVGFHISTGVLPTVLTGVVAALGLTGLVGRRVPERRFLLCALLAGIVIIGSGYVSGLGNPLAGPIDHFINGPLAPMRNLRKFDPLIRLPIALGLAQLLATVQLPRLRTAVRLVAVGALAFVALPAYTGGLSQAGDFQSFPAYWVSAVNWLNAHAGNDAVLEVPGARFGEYIWGRPMDDVMEALYSGDWASMQLSAIGSVGNTRLLDAIEQQVDAGEGSAGLTQLLARMGVKYVLVRDDLIRSDLYGAWPARVNDALYESPGLRKVAQFGGLPVGYSLSDNSINNFDSAYPPVEIFQVDDARPVATVVPAADTVRVYGGPEALLTMADQGVLKGRPVLLNSDSPGLPASQYVITDSLRRIVRNFGEIRIDYTQTLTASDPLSTFEAADDYLEPSWLRYESVAQYHGIANITASSSASDITALPGQSATGRDPFAAIDGDPQTNWESGSLGGPVGQWLQVEFDRAQDPGTIEAAFADNPLIGPPVTRVSVQTAAGKVTDSVRRTDRPQRLAVPAGPSRWLRITITGVVAEPYSLEGSQAAISQLSIPGVTATRTIEAPAVTVPGTAEPSVLLAKSQPQPSDCMLTSMRWVCSPYLSSPTEEQYGFDEGFTSARGHAASLSGLAILTSTGRIARYAWPGSDQPVVTASSTYTADPEDMASAAFDDNLSTAWISGPGDRHPVLTIRWHGVRTIKDIAVVSPPGADSPDQVYVTDPAGQVGGGFVGLDGKLTFAKPMRTDELTLRFSPAVLPVQVSEVVIPGVRELATNPSRAVRLRCGLGPTISVDGKVIPTRATGTYADLLFGRPLAFTACSPAQVVAGQNTVVEAAADPTGWDVQSVLVDSTGRGSLQAATPARAEPVKTLAWGDSSRLLRVRASQRSYLEVAQNFNAGWQATMDGSVLQPVQLDGWEQAWLLPAGKHGLVSLTYLPDATYRAALFGGLALLVLVIALALVPLHRRRKAAVAPAAAPMPDRELAGRTARSTGLSLLLAAGGTVGLAGIGLWLAGYPGVLVLPAAAFLFTAARSCLARDRIRALRPVWRILASTWLVVGLMVLAAAGGAAGDWLRYRGDTGVVVTALWDVGPQLLCLLIVARIAAELPGVRESRQAGH